MRGDCQRGLPSSKEPWVVQSEMQGPKNRPPVVSNGSVRPKEGYHFEKVGQAQPLPPSPEKAKPFVEMLFSPQVSRFSKKRQGTLMIVLS